MLRRQKWGKAPMSAPLVWARAQSTDTMASTKLKWSPGRRRAHWLVTRLGDLSAGTAAADVAKLHQNKAVARGGTGIQVAEHQVSALKMKVKDGLQND